jgi:NADP-dependent 3-hydroxy acid dehydrogenase YdfG
MDLQLTNKKALVTGSTAGNGFAIDALLAHEGASVACSPRASATNGTTLRVDGGLVRSIL